MIYTVQKKIIYTTLLIFCFSIFSLGKDILVYSIGNKELGLVYYDDDSNINQINMLSRYDSVHITRHGKIYVLKKNSPNIKKSYVNGKISVVFFDTPVNYYNIYSGFCVDREAGLMYFPQRQKNNSYVTLMVKNISTSKVDFLLNDKNIYHIGEPVLSPKKDKIAFYFAKEKHYQLQIGVFDIKNKRFSTLTPPSTPILPFGPYMGGGPVWDKEGKHIFYVGRYQDDFKQTGMDFIVYKTHLKNTKKTLTKLGAGYFPFSVNNEVMAALELQKGSIAIYKINTFPMEKLFSGKNGKVSLSGKYCAYVTKSNELCIHNIPLQKSTTISKKSYDLAFWWIY
jgi:hypothetical protein